MRYLSLALFLFVISASVQATGFQRLSITASDGHTKMEAAVWYPSKDSPTTFNAGPVSQEVAVGGAIAGSSLPLVVISHGTGGSLFSHYDTAIALADAGFIAVAFMHPGDNYADQSKAIAIMERPKHISRALDYLLSSWPERARIDPKRIGIFGFSAGGFTALVSIGGKPDLMAVGPHCEKHPKDFACMLVARHSGSMPAISASSDGARKDERLRAAVIAAPALGFTFSKSGLQDVDVPVQLWRAEHDAILPHPWYAEAVRNSLPHAPEYHVVKDAGHYDFLAPCNARLAQMVPEICSSEKGFVRTEFHAVFNKSVVDFFLTSLKPQ